MLLRVIASTLLVLVNLENPITTWAQTRGTTTPATPTPQTPAPGTPAPGTPAPATPAPGTPPAPPPRPPPAPDTPRGPPLSRNGGTEPRLKSRRCRSRFGR